MKTDTLPETDSVQELAQFWDSHDVTDFEDDLEEVNEPIFERRSVIALQLESGEAEAVRKLAEKRGVADVDLISEWVREKISQ